MAKKEYEGKVIKELDPIGKYRVRVIEMDSGERVLDVREHVKGAKFGGFTKKAIRLDKVRAEEAIRIFTAALAFL